MLETCTIEKRDTGIFLANEKKTKWVTLITFITMIVEIVVGYWSGSMALLADGWHMASHTLALGLSLVVYFLYRHPRFKSSFTFGGGKILSLGGYTSSLFLAIIGLTMVYESFMRFYEVREIHYNEAIWVAVIGLVVNLVCAFIMHRDEDHDHGHSHGHSHGGHKHGPGCNHNKLAPHTHTHDHGHKHEHKKVKPSHDHNHQSAYMHIMTDALTSVFAIAALLLGQWFGWIWLDPFVGLVGGFVVFKWAIALIRESGRDLLDAHEVSIDRDKLILKLEKDGSKVVDIHLWRLAPGQVGCELIIKRNHEQHSADYRNLITDEFHIHHLIVEVI